MSVREVEKGIYYLEGDPIPMQLIIVPRLSAKNNYWLQHLRSNLRRGREIEELMERYEKHSQSRWYQSAMDLIVRANWENMKEEKIRLICEAAAEYAPDYDVDRIYDKLTEREERQ